MLILIGMGSGLLYLAWAYINGIWLQMSNFTSDFGQLVNRNLLAPWQPDEDFFIWTGRWCAPGSDRDWPKTRKECAFLGAAVAGCSALTYGRSCAVISVPKIYFDDPSFRQSLRVALANLCAAFATPRDEPMRARLPGIYYHLGCGDDRAVSLSVYINVLDIKIEPPYAVHIPPPFPKRVAVAYFSAWSKQISLVSKERE
jgi:hypothetical protein